MLSKKYQPQTTESKLRQFWDKQGIYKFDINSSKEIYSIDTPPPTVSGKLHIGHIFSYTQAEMIARYKRMRGYNVFYPFGFDDNGLPTERLVENNLNLQANQLPRSEFIDKCHETVEKYENEFKDLWSSLGFSCDWSLLYKTISPLSQKISQKSFIDLYQKNKAYLEESPVLYCTSCQTSIAQAELETKNKASTFNYLSFEVDDQTITIATTRPELLNSCQAILVNPNDSKNLHLVGKKARVPLYNNLVPIMQDEDVELAKGSGMVMLCTFGDTKDLEWYQKYKLDYRQTITTQGLIANDVKFIGGMSVRKARKHILELLNENGLLLKSVPVEHTVSVHERCSHEIEIIPSQQWYIDLLSSQDEFIKLADHINWYPRHMKARYLSWVENLKWDWCISRQRFFGVPFPVWYCQDCGQIITASEAELPVNPVESEPAKSCKCGSRNFRPETAVLDTWATSSVSPLINSHWGEPNDITDKLIPMSMRTQAHEIIRTWAFYTIVKSYYHLNRIPWQDIMVCGFVLARKGEKISKSKKNSPLEPWQLIKNHSADGIRYWSASAKLGTDTTFSEEDLKIARRFITKLWNAARFSLMHLKDYQRDTSEALLPPDQWILQKLNKTVKKACEHLDGYEVGLARNIIDDFFWKDYCDNYLELVKDRLYKPELYGAANRASAQYAIYHTLLGILKLYAVFTPFITEEIYQSFYMDLEESCSIHLLEWQLNNDDDESLIVFGEYLKNVLAEVRKYKTEHSLSMKAEIKHLTVAVPAECRQLIERSVRDLESTTHAQTITIKADKDFQIFID